MSGNTRRDIIVFAIRDYAAELPGEQSGEDFTALLWMSADDIADKIEHRLDTDSLEDGYRLLAAQQETDEGRALSAARRARRDLNRQSRHYPAEEQTRMSGTYKHPAGILPARIGAVREFCAAQIAHDALPGSGLTDRAWCAQGVLNILDGLTDWQLS